MIHKKNFEVFVIIIITFLLSCNTTEPPQTDDRKLTLTFEDASCIEAWINISTENIQLPATINVFINDSLSQVSILTTQDSLFYIDSLLPNKTYTIQSFIHSTNQAELSSNELSFTTMDTTSHNFTFETWTFGDVGSSVLYDVAIIDENNIWAVGEINIADTSENGYTTYNAVHWDGNEWELKRIFFPTVCGSTNLTSYPAKAIFIFDDGEIWISSSGDKIAILKNGVQTDKFCLPSTVSMSINKIWVTSSNDIYVIGNGGSIAHYNGSQWQRIESGTELQFLDIYGATDPRTGEQEILAVCTRNLPLDRGIYRIKEYIATRISSSPIQWELYALWFIPSRHYYVVGSGIYEKKFLSDSLWQNEPLDITRYGTSGIRGNEINDIFVAGAFGELLHWNGISWKSYISEIGWFSGSYGGIAAKNNLVITVGYEGAQAKILLGRRIN